MPKDIAVLIGANGKTTSLFDAGKIVVYRKSKCSWHAVKEKEFRLDEKMSKPELLERMSEILDYLNACKVFVCLRVVGLPYFALEKARCSVWEFEGSPGDFLDLIQEREEEGKVKEANRREA